MTPKENQTQITNNMNITNKTAELTSGTIVHNFLNLPEAFIYQMKWLKDTESSNLNMSWV